MLGIELPKPQESIDPAALPGMLYGLIPQIFLFIVAFLVLALFWLGHPRQFHFVHQVDPALLWINILILIAIVFVPFSTDIAGDFPAVTIAALLFHVNMFIVGFLFAVQWRHIHRHEHLCEPVPEMIVRVWSYRSLLVPAVAVIAVVIALVSPALSLLTSLVLPAGTYLLRQVPSP